MPREDLANLRLVCHDFGTRAAPALFNDLSITFRASTFSRPARLAALDRIGHHVKTLTFHAPHSSETFLPPLIDPWEGGERDFIYRPQVRPPTTITEKIKQPKYGDWETTDLLIKQYPPLFHAATNVASFIQVFSTFVNLSHLRISCPGQGASQRYRRSIVDYALISLRIAVERTRLDFLETLSLEPIHPSAMLYLSPLLAHGATPASPRRWSRIRHLTIRMENPGFDHSMQSRPDHLKMLHTYLRNFTGLTDLHFSWLGPKGPSPLPLTSQHILASSPKRDSPTPTTPSPRRRSPVASPPTHPAHRGLDSSTQRARASQPLHFPYLIDLTLENASMPASQIRQLLQTHRRTLQELDLDSISLASGTWDEALSPLSAISGSDRWKQQTTQPRSEEMGEVPIMLSASSPPPCYSYRPPLVRRDAAAAPRDLLVKQCPAVTALAAGAEDVRVRPVESRTVSGDNGNGAGVRRLLSLSRRKAGAKGKDGFWGCEEVRKAFKGGVFAWR